ncbi:MAG TPA: dihydrofolate reductase family protein [Actinomycetota bacterium]|nr:dihydrofolate reductase family protein [Actinomycetota bacterium]
MGMVSSWRSRDGYVAGPNQSEENQLGGGASTVQQYLAAGLVDGFDLHVVPVVLGAGERLLESVGDLRLEQVRAIEAPGVTHIKYRVRR